jgi:hypothetical protein
MLTVSIGSTSHDEFHSCERVAKRSSKRPTIPASHTEVLSEHHDQCSYCCHLHQFETAKALRSPWDVSVRP